MQLEYERLKYFLIHLLAWLGFIAYEQSILLIVGNGELNLLETGLTFALNAALFYANRLVLLPWLYARRQYAAYVAGVLGLIGCFALLRGTLNVYILPALHHLPPQPLGPGRMFWGETLYRGVYFVLLSFAYWFAYNAIRLEKQKRVQEHELRIAEKNLMEANLVFLKNQINPHFLFNSLNFLYAQVYPHSEETAKGILLLSDIMRYALQEDDNHGKVMLEKEVQHLRNYIAMNQLRFNQQLQVEFEVSDGLQFLMILPLVLITFVENCFKHGELSDPLNPLLIQLKTVDNELFFLTRNKKRSGPKEKSTGIGLTNTRQRLDMVYVGRYNLTVNDEQDYYTCTLTMTL